MELGSPAEVVLPDSLVEDRYSQPPSAIPFTLLTSSRVELLNEIRITQLDLNLNKQNIF